MNKLLYFVTGATFGSLVTWALVKGKYERMANEEIESVKEVFSKHSDISEKDEEETEEEDESDSEEKSVVAGTSSMRDYADAYKNIIKNNNYAVDEGGNEMINKPYVISPDEFGEDLDRETVSLTYYADGVLTDEENCIIDPGEIELMIGEDSLTHFGEYEDDSVFVRNEERNTDYEILRDERSYDDLVSY